LTDIEAAEPESVGPEPTGGGLAKPESAGPAVIVTPWYPNRRNPTAGSFVRDWARALALPPDQVTVVHLEMVPPGDPAEPERRQTPQGAVWWIPVKVGDNLPRAQAAEAQLAALTPDAIAAIQAAAVVWGHVTMPSGWAVSQVLREGQRLILVEHASYVPQLLGRADSRAKFGQAVRRAAAVLTAGELTADQIRRAFPADRGKVWAVGNPVDGSEFRFAPREAPAELSHWLYVGNLYAAKGVARVVEAFAAYCADNARSADGARQASRRPTLTLVGRGGEEANLRQLSRRLGVGEQVKFSGPLDKPAVARTMASADIQVHLSPGETFGLAPLEGLLTGLPLVVARNAGTSQTMGPAVRAGRAVMVEPPKAGAKGAAKVAEAVRRLERRLAEAGPEAALEVRRAIVHRYGLADFGAMERRVADGSAPYEAPDPQLRPLVAVALSRAAWDELADQVRAALWEGRPVTAAVAKAELAAGADPRVNVAELSAASQVGAGLARWLWLAIGGPFAIYRRALAVLAKAPGPPGRLVTAWRRTASDKAAALNAFNRSRLEPAVLRWAATNSAVAAQAAAVKAISPPGAEIATARADPEGLRQALA
jgi:glycosyltransferase involved in cell wall biosynthesis